MKRALLRLLSTSVHRPCAILLYVFVAATSGSQAAAQVVSLPVLGSRVSEQVIAARNGDQQCLTDIDHHDPCTSIKIKNVLFTIAWDADTKTVSYLFTEDHHFVTDSELGIGGSCNVAPKVGEPVALFPYLDWLVTPKWADTRQDLSGDALWYGMQHCGRTRPILDTPESQDSYRVDI